MHPRPIEAAMTMTTIASRIALVTSSEMSPNRPSLIAPTTAIAPMQTVSEAVRNASRNFESPSLPTFLRSQTPNFSILPSRSMAPPVTAPRMKLKMVIMVPVAPSAPF